VSMIPPARPKFSIVDARKVLAAFGVTDQVIIIGKRGYYQDTMGVAGKNDRGLYDDAMSILSPRAFKTFNANTDPSKQGGKLAVLQPGVWTMEPWTHHAGTPHAYPCLMQAEPVTVLRDNGIRETGMFDIEIHQGGYNTTGSLGCQTVWPDQYEEFKDLWKAEMAFYGMKRIDYLLYEEATP
jgi:hypothetical protein